MLVYLGSSGGDVDLKFLKKVIGTIIDSEYPVHLFGNKKLGKLFETNCDNDVIYHCDLSDDILAKLYSNSMVTICPQLWELFGYTAVESMACGTPVLAFNYFGHSETIINGKTGLLANTEDEFINNLSYILNNSIEFNTDVIRKHVIKNFSIDASVHNLIKCLEVLKNE